MSVSSIGAGSTGRKSVAVLIFDDVKVLDFAGPFEVFGVARDSSGASAFDVETIALDAAPVVARNGLRILPRRPSQAVTAAAVLVAPGATARAARCRIRRCSRTSDA